MGQSEVRDGEKGEENQRVIEREAEGEGKKNEGKEIIQRKRQPGTRTKAGREADILAALSAGMSIRGAATAYKTSTTTVMRIKQQATTLAQRIDRAAIYQAQRTTQLTEVERTLLHSVEDQACIDSAGLEARARALKVVSDLRRLEEGKATAITQTFVESALPHAPKVIDITPQLPAKEEK